MLAGGRASAARAPSCPLMGERHWGAQRVGQLLAPERSSSCGTAPRKVRQDLLRAILGAGSGAGSGASAGSGSGCGSASSAFALLLASIRAARALLLLRRGGVCERGDWRGDAGSGGGSLISIARCPRAGGAARVPTERH